MGRNGKQPVWEWEWPLFPRESIPIAGYSVKLNGYSVKQNLRVLLLMTTLTENNICDFLRKSKIKTYNILNYYFSAFCTIKVHT